MADRRCCRDATPASYIGVIFTMADEWKVAYGLSNAIFNDLETPPLTQFSRSQRSFTLNISETVRDTDIVSMEY